MATSDYAEAVGQALRDKRAARGILLCGSGVGVSMAVQLAWTRPEHDVQMMAVRLSEVYI